MNGAYLIQELNSIENAKRVNRLRVANLILAKPELFKYLLEITFDVNNKTSIKAAWVLEFVCDEKLDWLAPYLDYFTENIANVKFDSAVRPITKICQFIAKAYTSKKESAIKQHLTKKHIDIIIENGFDWLIGNQKVAVKAYTMEMLYLFGKNYKWVHKELQLVIQQSIINESCGYQARGKKILSWINQK
ncbi:adenylosuccinate lyase [Lutibacter sp. B1]|uniref:adenylosuccinate lyase n=1 Tax=Lutibacter sp. B1 TaxID=2725996 RepID=UPI0014576667|nr:adenylosuccinate lyase [Lutibacter sp. B1]NLP58439.1 adenylosuccinate lyase [Lutibacter sp. B1]